jgi:carboxypeptidase C (cathepsin A)
MLGCMSRILILAAALWLAGCGGGGGGGGGAPTPTVPVPGNFVDPNVYSSAANGSVATPNEASSSVQGTVTVNGQALSYTATAGHLTARRLGTDTPDASMFYVAYTLNGANPATRPVTFFYNGGPGSSTIWLHLGSYAPKRLAAQAPSQTVERPFPMVDNAESLLDVTDLVFVDMVGTGFSSAIAPNRNNTFWSVDADAAVFRDFIRRYIAVNNRPTSPRFLFGESYGTTRSAVLANLMETAGVRLNGVVLLSSVLNYNTNCGLLVESISCAGYFPAYGTVGAYHQRTTPVRAPSPIDDYAEQMRVLTASTYAPAVATFFATHAVPDPATLQLFTNATGIPVANWQGNLNMTPNAYRATLIPGTALGRYDARMTAPGASANSDISSIFIGASFSSQIDGYLANTLHFTTPGFYAVETNAINTWDFGHAGLSLPDTVPDLMAALTLNPRLRVLAVSGYHDLATPFHQTERDVQRTGPHPNIQVRNYDGGHMMYLSDASRVRQKADLVQFYQLATQP